ncbi:MAG: DUF3179 domain-containing protein [Candidatus Aenigmarchaeota archaeon]|nr:DUF3179 domain-containing protein [Candidatus Aenigmarchaeota archaeon]
MKKGRPFLTYLIIILILAAAGGAVLLSSRQSSSSAAKSASEESGIMVTGGVKHTVPLNEILTVLPKDAIPAIDDPKFVSASQANLNGEDIVLGLFFEGQARAYPLAIMNWHEIINDRINGKPVAVTYCPLCGTGIAFDSRIGGKETTLGVSGKLYNSDLVMYDRATESYWSQVSGEAIRGELAGQKLEQIHIETVRWKNWVKLHPDTLVLSRETGFSRNYDVNPYEGYDTSSAIYFPISSSDSRLGPKERVAGIEIGGKFKAYPLSVVANRTVIHDEFNGKPLLIVEDQNTYAVKIFERELNGQALTFEIRDRTLFDQNGNAWNFDGSSSAGKLAQLQTVEGFWFAWAAFHPETELYA